MTRSEFISTRVDPEHGDYRPDDVEAIVRDAWEASQATSRIADMRREAFVTGLSLGAAVQAAGGRIDPDAWKGMTLEDFVAQVAASNGIRFVFDPNG